MPPSDACSFDWQQLVGSCGSCLRPGGTDLTRRALAACPLPAHPRIIDVGCGAGGTLLHLEQSGYQTLTGVDHSNALLEEAARHLSLSRLVQADAQQLPFPDGSFDLLLCECVLSTLPHPGAALDEFTRVLDHGGCLVLSDLCARGDDTDSTLVTGEKLTEQLTARGFSLLLTERHDRLPGQFAAHMIMAGETLPHAWGCGGKRGVPPPGYFLAAARKVS